jgi:hypothetical protein
MIEKFHYAQPTQEKAKKLKTRNMRTETINTCKQIMALHEREV